MSEPRNWFDDGTGAVRKVMVRAFGPLTEAQVVAAIRSNGDRVPNDPRRTLEVLRRRGRVIVVGKLWGRPRVFGRSGGC